jgi:hypothetical protein
MAWSFSYNPFPREQKPAVQLKREAAIVLALGGGFQAYFTQNRDGSVRLDEMQVIGGSGKICPCTPSLVSSFVQIPQVALLCPQVNYHHNAKSLFPHIRDNRRVYFSAFSKTSTASIWLAKKYGARYEQIPVIVIPNGKTFHLYFAPIW